METTTAARPNFQPFLDGAVEEARKIRANENNDQRGLEIEDCPTLQSFVRALEEPSACSDAEWHRFRHEVRAALNS